MDKATATRLWNRNERAAIQDAAQRYMAAGFPGECLTHVIYGGNRARGVATPLKPNESLDGLTERYYTLAELAAIK